MLFAPDAKKAQELVLSNAARVAIYGPPDLDDAGLCFLVISNSPELLELLLSRFPAQVVPFDYEIDPLVVLSLGTQIPRNIIYLFNALAKKGH